MPCDVVDPSLIMNEPRKRKLASYATNEDNCSADKSETIKRMKKTAGLTDSDSLLSLAKADDPHLDATPRESEDGHRGSKLLLKPRVPNRGAAHVTKSKPKLKAKSARQPSPDDSVHVPDEDADRDSSNVEEIEIDDSEGDVEEAQEAAEEDPEHELGK